ncbi:MAG: hypothetical protein JSS32_06425 [Verrucomicrobia bacterium]|nr:hypothetical protein [Verrucomicrobiota bacterium]
MGTYVGQLQEEWQFPSDHMPIGMSYDQFNILSWNVLDSDYMGWVIEQNSQGLSRSMLAKEHVYIGNSKLTVRDQHVAELILQTINHPTHPRSILALQECSEPFLQELRSRLPDHFEVVVSHGEALLVDKRYFEIEEEKEVYGIFTDTPARTVQDVTLRRLDNGDTLRVVNAHLPGDPTKPGRYEFGKYLAETFDPKISTLALGDMNFNEIEMGDAMRQAFSSGSPFSIYSPYCTNITPFDFTTKVIDHFIVYTRSPVAIHAPDQIMPGLSQTVDLLQTPRKKTTTDIAEFALKNCQNVGTLQKTRDYVYVKLDEAYLDSLFNKIQEEHPKARRPRFHGDVGPHFTLIRHDEWKETPEKEIVGIGDTFSFTPARIEMVQTAHKKLWTLVVEPSEELSNVRKQYAVSDKPHGHEFHITLAQE